MKKLLLIISNNDGLPGVKKDVASIIKYFTSPIGGMWQNSEINCISDESRKTILTILNIIRIKKYDYLVIYFSGHGYYKRGTNVIINNNKEEIAEEEFDKLANRQLTIFDCCRGFEEEESVGLSDLIKELKYNREKIYTIRERFDKRIMRAKINAHYKLYSCSKGEYSGENNDGGYYTQTLIREANSCLPGEIDPICLQEKVKEFFLFEYHNQTPDYSAPKLLREDRIIFGIQDLMFS